MITAVELCGVVLGCYCTLLHEKQSILLTLLLVRPALTVRGRPQKTFIAQLRTQTVAKVKTFKSAHLSVIKAAVKPSTCERHSLELSCSSRKHQNSSH